MRCCFSSLRLHIFHHFCFFLCAVQTFSSLAINANSFFLKCPFLFRSRIFLCFSSPFIPFDLFWERKLKSSAPIELVETRDREKKNKCVIIATWHATNCSFFLIRVSSECHFIFISHFTRKQYFVILFSIFFLSFFSQTLTASTRVISVFIFFLHSFCFFRFIDNVFISSGSRHRH